MKTIFTILILIFAATSARAQMSQKDLFELRGVCIDLGKKQEAKDAQWDLDNPNMVNHQIRRSYSTHYNQKTNRCYVYKLLETFSPDFKTKTGVGGQLLDGQDSSLLYGWYHSTAKTADGEWLESNGWDYSGIPFKNLGWPVVWNIVLGLMEEK